MLSFVIFGLIPATTRKPLSKCNRKANTASSTFRHCPTIFATSQKFISKTKTRQPSRPKPTVTKSASSPPIDWRTTTSSPPWFFPRNWFTHVPKTVCRKASTCFRQTTETASTQTTNTNFSISISAKDGYRAGRKRQTAILSPSATYPKTHCSGYRILPPERKNASSPTRTKHNASSNGKKISFYSFFMR